MKNLLVLFFLFTTASSAFSQLDPYKWRLGISGGYTNYYGDLSPHKISSIGDFPNLLRLFNYNENYVTDYSYGLSLERAINATLGLEFSAGKYSISMSDRYRNPNNVFQFDAPNFMRSLNFKTEIMDYGVGLVFKSDNGRILSKNAFIAPYLTLGAGWLHFKVFGDLYDDDGSPYDYTRPETVNNGHFETRLDRLNTEVNDGYATNAFYGSAGLGVRFRVTKQLELFAQSDFKLTTTDYLDDVSNSTRLEYDSPQQQYAARPNGEWNYDTRGNANGGNDWYINHRLGVKISFGFRKASFTASRMVPGYSHPTVTIPTELAAPLEPIDSVALPDKESGVTNNYITFIQLNQPYNRDSSYYSFKLLEADFAILNAENRLARNKNSLDSLNTELATLEARRKEAASDSAAPNPAVILSIDEQIGEGERLLENALQERATIEEELQTARQNKSLFVSAYNLSLEERETRDSLAFMNEISELPAAVKEALAYRGAYYRIGQDTTGNTEMYSSNQSQGTEYFSEGIADSPSEPNNPSQSSSAYNNELYSELLRERARSNNLLNELRNYDQAYLSRESLYAEGADKWQRYYNDRGRRAPDNYLIRGMNASAGRRNDSPYIVPVFVPGNTGRVGTSPQEIDNEKVRPGNIPQQLQLDSDQKKPISSVFNSDEANFPPRAEIAFPPLSKDRMPVADSLSETINNTIINSKVEVYFENDQRSPEEQELKKLLPLIEFVKNNPGVSVTISGFADNTGPLQYNLNLIQDRIAGVQNFLIEENGISSERVNVLSGGLIVRESGKRPSPSDRKVEVWMHEND